MRNIGKMYEHCKREERCLDFQLIYNSIKWWFIFHNEKEDAQDVRTAQ